MLISGAPNNTIGGPVTRKSNPRNIISGNNFRGISVEGANATGNKVMGNRIGTNASGTQKLSNGGVGVAIDDAPDNTIGGTSPAVRNLISGNESHGLVILGTGATNNRVMGNFIGIDASGKGDLGNTLHGVAIDDAANNTIGGTKAAARNIISGNIQGVLILGANATGNRILSNSINDNVGRGIELGDPGVNANDPGDGDTGPNHQDKTPTVEPGLSRYEVEFRAGNDIPSRPLSLASVIPGP